MAAISNSLVSMRNPPAQFSTGTLFSHISYFLVLSVFFFFWFFQILLYWLLNYVSYTMILLAFLESIDSGWKISFFDQLERFTSIPFSFLIIMFRVLSFDPNNKLIIFVGFFPLSMCESVSLVKELDLCMISLMGLQSWKVSVVLCENGGSGKRFLSLGLLGDWGVFAYAIIDWVI